MPSLSEKIRIHFIPIGWISMEGSGSVQNTQNAIDIDIVLRVLTCVMAIRL